MREEHIKTNPVKQTLVTVMDELISNMEPLKAEEFKAHRYLLKTDRLEVSTAIGLINHVPGFNIEITSINVTREEV